MVLSLYENTLKDIKYFQVIYVISLTLISQNNSHNFPIKLNI